MRNLRPRSQPGPLGPAVTCPVPLKASKPYPRAPIRAVCVTSRRSWLITQAPDFSKMRQYGGWGTWK